MQVCDGYALNVLEDDAHFLFARIAHDVFWRDKRLFFNRLLGLERIERKCKL